MVIAGKSAKRALFSKEGVDVFAVSGQCEASFGKGYSNARFPGGIVMGRGYGL
jgi:hypothetical protein